jgi:hypothetical protein
MTVNGITRGDKEMNEIKIEKNIPLTESHGFTAKWTDVFRKMEVGDSFVAPLGNRGGVMASAKAFGEAHNWKFTSRKISENEVRIWRIEDVKED